MSAPSLPGADRWARVNDLFHRALEQPADARDAFLEAACAGDAHLRSEVSSLLASHQRAGSFIEQPAREDARLTSSSPGRVSALVNRTIGQYRILQVIGEGGMGVVYLAEDTRLGRTVALKAIAPTFAGHASRRERLRREARAAASLNHPGIATVYALEEIEDCLYIASEYVPGETIREELRRGPLGARRAMQTVIAMTRALVVAHDRGIIHRDLKPENVIRTGAGDIKILDFGLAQFHEGQSSATGLTLDGTLLGTPAYMSPEQIRGGTVDARSDIFALGIMLYELVCGVHPFGGADPAPTIARILETEPAGLVDRLPATTDSGVRELEHVVLTCLQKSPDARIQSTRELASALDGALTATEPADIQTTNRAHPSIGPSSDRRRPRSPHAFWWWQFHQAAATVSYSLLLVPLWRTRMLTAGSWGTALFLAGLVSVIVAGGLRLHLWFAARLYPSEWIDQRSRSARWILAADVAFVVSLLAGGLLAIATNVGVAILLVAAAAATLLSFVMIEPATTRAAFGEG